MSEHLDLADYRRRVASMYATLRADPRPTMALVAFRATKDRLFATHPQSPIPAGERAAFRGLSNWRHVPSLRFSVPLEPDPTTSPHDLPRSSGGSYAFSRIGWVTFSVGGTECRLAVYWLEGYGGGIFIPFRDATGGSTSYGGGRYVWDSVKGADLGSEDDRLVIDFNYAYHPSCVYDPHWSCPLALQENWLTIPIEAGERLSPEYVADHDRETT